MGMNIDEHRQVLRRMCQDKWLLDLAVESCVKFHGRGEFGQNLVKGKHRESIGKAVVQWKAVQRSRGLGLSHGQKGNLSGWRPGTSIECHHDLP